MPSLALYSSLCKSLTLSLPLFLPLIPPSITAQCWHQLWLITHTTICLQAVRCSYFLFMPLRHPSSTPTSYHTHHTTALLSNIFILASSRAPLTFFSTSALTTSQLTDPSNPVTILSLLSIRRRTRSSVATERGFLGLPWEACPERLKRRRNLILSTRYVYFFWRCYLSVLTTCTLSLSLTEVTSGNVTPYHVTYLTSRITLHCISSLDAG